MTAVLAWFGGSALGRTLAALGGLAVAALLLFHAGARRGARRQKEKAREADIENADRIRNRVRAVRARGVRPDEIRYRD